MDLAVGAAECPGQEPGPLAWPGNGSGVALKFSDSGAGAEESEEEDMGNEERGKETRGETVLYSTKQS